MNESLKKLKNGHLKKHNIKKDYKKFIKRKIVFSIFCFIIIASVSGIAATLGSYPITVIEVYSIIWNAFPIIIQNIVFIFREGMVEFIATYLSTTENIVVWNLRLPRIVMGIVAGMGLAIAGTSMQGILRNPLASPFTLGISSGAGFGASLAIILGIGVIGGEYLIVVNAFIFSLIPAFFIMAFAKTRKATPETMILAGIAIGSIFSAATTFMMFFADEEAVKEAVFWGVGSLGRASWENIFYMFIMLGVCSIYLFRRAWDLNALGTGDETAKSLGINVERIRLSVMVVAALLTASIISFVGTIGFIGLVAPHVTRIVIGGDNKYVLPISGLLGGTVLLTADTIARTIMAPIILPVGVLTSFIGGPLFLYLLMKRRTEFW